MSRFEGPLRYHSYLLRFWQVTGQVELSAVWRFSLTDPHTGDRHGFANLDALVAFLHCQIDAEPLDEKGGDNL